MSGVVGYEFLRESLKLSALPPRRPAHVNSSVNRVVGEPTSLRVPSAVAPATQDPLTHLQFALKHEGVNLGILAQVLPKLEPSTIVDSLKSSPTSSYLRMIAFLWEQFTCKELVGSPTQSGNYVDLFDPERFVTGKSVRFPRWRINWNGLGDLRSCATVELTPAIREGLEGDVLGRAREFANSLPKDLLQRTTEWAYLHETQSSFAIERETASEPKAHTFMRLLARAHDGRALSEDYLAELQAATVSNPFDQAVAFRTQQNWLSGPGRGSISVTYVPPPPSSMRTMMESLMVFANEQAPHVPALVAASVLSFGFVYAHPFMDGNGRLSRFLFHYALCRAGALDNGSLLPVSVAMQQHESEYLAALKAFSAPARERWQVRWIDDAQYDFQFDASDDIYRYWDATIQTEFSLKMAEYALDAGLMQEASFLRRFDAIKKEVEAHHDVRGSDLSQLIMMCLDNNGRVSMNRRKQFVDRVPEAVFAAIEQAAASSASVDSAPSP